MATKREAVQAVHAKRNVMPQSALGRIWDEYQVWRIYDQDVATEVLEMLSRSGRDAVLKIQERLRAICTARLDGDLKSSVWLINNIQADVVLDTIRGTVKAPPAPVVKALVFGSKGVK